MPTNKSAAARLAELRALRASGKTRISTYEVDDVENVYDEVDDEGYKKIVRNRLDQDDFVVGDTGEGYADDGREDWQAEQHEYFTEESESDSELPRQSKGSESLWRELCCLHTIDRVLAKRKRETDREHQLKVDAGIGKYFSANPATAPVKPKAATTAEDAAFMADLLGEVNVNVAAGRKPALRRPVKDDVRRKTRVLSPPLTASRQHKTTARPSEPIQMIDTVSDELPDNDDPLPALEDAGDDSPMSDPPLPSSPVTRAVERRNHAANQQEDVSGDEDDMMEVSQVQGHSAANITSVNIAGSRPALKPKKQEQSDLPTPESSSPPRPAADTQIDASSWNDITNRLHVVSSPPTESVGAGKLASQDALEEDGSLRFFWVDYTELNGSLLLFGKVKNKKNNSFVSCFVKVDNILRKLFFLPRQHRHKNGRELPEEVEMGDVFEEVDNLMSRMRVGMHKIKPCLRKYAFEVSDIPREAEYLKLLYPYDKPALAIDTKGETFSHVLGTNTSIFEQFVLWKNIMGPCWLKIDDASFTAVNNASWCKLEVQVGKPADICTLGDSDNLEAPPMTLMSLALRTSMNQTENKQEIVMASARIYENVSLADITPAEKMPCKTLTVIRPPGDNFPMGFKVEAEKHKGVVRLERSEQGLLSWFLAQMQRFDPDVLVGHRLEDLDYSVLLSRFRERKTPGWHRIGRLRRRRLMVDLGNDMGKSLMTKCQSWSLAEMCELVLGKNFKRRDIDNETALRTWASTREGLMNYVRHCEADTFFIAAIALKVQMLPLTKVLTNLAGNSWARTLTGTRAERNEYILLHEFHRNKYICPDKVFNKPKSKLDEEEPAQDGGDAAENKKKDKYQGGLVFEPEKGLYDRCVLVMDFNSLYPSIIQEYNICFTTVNRSHLSETDERVPEPPSEEQEKGVLPRLIATLVSRRREVKKLMKDKQATADQLATWDIKQLALKLTANSMYGCLGYTKSRFYARPLAMLTTFKGREILRSTKEVAEQRLLQVIYGDTDSVMINTNSDSIKDAIKIGNEFKDAINGRYRLLEIDIDNVFRRILLHAKKKYAAINMVEIDGNYVEKLEVKGLDMRRREYCGLSKETSSTLLNFLLSGEDPETTVSKIHAHLRDLATRMRSFDIPMHKYIIFTQLSKAPSEYPHAKSMPSVQVANKLIARGKAVRAKDVMSFVITGTNNGSQESAASNAMPQEDCLRPDTELKPDIDYYLHKQILPPVERLCAPVSLTNVTRLAECLGLDTSKYRVSRASENKEDTEIRPLDSQVPDHVRFAACDPLTFKCLSCHQRLTYRGLLDADSQSLITHAGITCTACKTPFRNLTIVAQVEAQIRALLARYYEGWLICDDPSCGNRTRQMSVYGHRCLGPQGLARGCLGRMSWEMSAGHVWNQLIFYERAFDVERVAKAGAVPSKASEGKDADESEKIKVLAEVNRIRFGTVRGVVKGYLERNGRQFVDMGGLFGFALQGVGM
ncbi:MAG: hypothetical protein Q9162_004313 [Coniocarpon cinnabarinum]